MSTKLIGIPYLEGSDVNADGSLSPNVGKGKPVLVMVQGNFCGYCTKAKPAFQELANALKNVVCCTVQTDGGPSDKEANAKLSVVNKSPGVPAFLGFNSQGKFMASHNGNRDVASLKAFADSLR